jgi:diguanylate cyclase (GGDEF)-like protein/PAS domain S-box-containing protein
MNDAPVARPARTRDEINEIVLSLVNHLDAMVAYWDIDQVNVFANDAYRHWFGKSGEELRGMTLAQLLGPTLYAKNLPYIREAYAGRIQVFEREIPSPGGTIRHSLATYTPHVVDGQVRGIFVHVADVSPLKALETELRAAKAEAERLATHDFLTGLPNRVLLADRITQALAMAGRTGRMVAGMSLDVDDFKRINDTYGHAAGDRLLVELALRLRQSVRECDSVTRMGGDELFLLLPEVESRQSAEATAERVLANVSEPFRIGAVTIAPSCSLGIALCAPSSATPETLVEHSDLALMEAKRLGKARYVVSDCCGTAERHPPD